jgi:predicted acetyltransferase
MGVGDLHLVEPNEDMREQYLEYIDAFRAAGESGHQDKRERVVSDFAGFVRKCRDEAVGRNLTATQVPMTSYWLVRGGRILATCRLRHRLNEVLAQHGGHIGYDSRPDERCKGYATRLLAMVLEKARGLGLTRVMLTCDKQNIASARVIQKNGGVLNSEYWWDDNGKKVMIQNYWIEL